MNEAEVRARIRELLRSGALPRMLPPMPPLKPEGPAGDVGMQFGVVSGATCLGCGVAEPTLTYSYPNGQVVRLHDLCDAIWRHERERV